MKRSMIIFVITLFLTAILPFAALAESIPIYIDGVLLETDVPAAFIDGNTMAPLRAVFEAFGANVEWDDEIKTALGQTSDRIISLSLGSQIAYVNGTAKMLPIAPQVINERVMVPLRFVAESLGAVASYDPSTNVITINKVAVPSTQVANPGMDFETVKKKVIVASETTYPPFEMVDDKNGEYIGFDMDLIRAIAESQGCVVEITSLGFDALIPAVQSGIADCAISGISITPERKASVDFTDPYFTNGLVVAVRADNTTIKSKADLKGKIIAAEVGTIGWAAADNIMLEDPKTQVKVFDGLGDAFLEMEKGSADAVISDRSITAYYIQTTGSGKVKMVGEVFEANEHYGILVKKGNTQILNMLNAGLKEVKENGEYDAIKQKYFGTLPSDIFIVDQVDNTASQSDDNNTSVPSIPEDMF